MNDATSIKITAIVALTTLEAINLITANVDGTVLVAVAGLIGGVAGYGMRKRRRK